MLLQKARDPATGQPMYVFEAWPRDGGPPSPSTLGGSVTALLSLVVRADRIESRWTWCHSSGHAQLDVDGEVQVIARGDAGWPAWLVSTLTERLGAELGPRLAPEVDRVLKDPNAFVADVEIPRPRHLLTVADTFDVRGRGLVLAPFLDESEAQKDRFEVELRRPDGSTARATAFAQIPFITPTPPKLQAHVTLVEIAKRDVPIGTEVWTVD